MRLNKSSMDKLYDLMTMGVKLQLVSARCPEEAVVHVLLNHLETVRAMVSGSGEVSRLVTAVIDRVGAVYGPMAAGQLQMIRLAMLEFLKDRKVRVSLFLEDKLQSQDGMFALKAGSGPLPFHIEAPGVVRYMGADGKKVGSAQWDFRPPFPTLQSTEPALVVFNPGAVRYCQLGMNVYAKERKGGSSSSSSSSAAGAAASGAGSHRGSDAHSPGYVPSDDRVRQAVGGVNLLASMVGAGKADDVINMNLFQDGDDPVSYDSPAQSAAAQAEREAPVTHVVFSSRSNNMPRNVEELKGLVKGWGDDDLGRGPVKRRDEEEDLLDLLGE
jgi:hypothetical protein